MVPPVKQSILYLLTFSDFDEKVLLSKMSSNQVDSLKACSESPFPYEMAEKIGSFENLDLAKKKIAALIDKARAK